jgi:hypothetical protein
MKAPRRTLAVAILPALLIAATMSGSAAAHGPQGPKVKVLASGLNNPRGIDIGLFGRPIVAEAATGNVLVIGRNGARTLVSGLPHATSPEGESTGPVNVAVGARGRISVLIGEGPHDLDPRFATIQKASGGTIADIAAYQVTDPDPADKDGIPEESNPYGIAALGGGRLLVADAANNDILLVGRDGSIRTVARIPLHVVSTAHVGDPSLPPMLPAEAVPTSVTVGRDGYWYVGELTGFPFTPGASRIWRIAPWARNATCDEDTADGCKLFADGFTSITGLDAGPDGSLYVVEIVKNGVLGLFTGTDTTGALIRLKRGHQTEIAAGRLTAPADVAVGRDGTLYVTNKSVMPDGEVLSIRR